MASAPATALQIEPSNASLEEAAEWYAVLRSGHASAQDQSRWQAWLATSAEHQIAWRYVEDISRRFTALQETPDPLQTSSNLFQATVRIRQRRRTLTRLAILAGGGIAAGLAWRREWLPGPVLAWSADYRTTIGEQREIVLSDGSHLWLNTASAFNADYSPALRRIALVAGEIFIATAQDAGRPFVVDTAQGRMRALGTRFNVRQGDGQTWLAVYDGAVEITPKAGKPVVVQAGRQARFTAESSGPQGPTDPAREAWTQGLLVAQDIALRDVVSELRRYRNGHIGLADDVADLKVYGNFPIRDTEQTLTMLATVLPIQIHHTLPWWINIEPRR